MGLELAWGEGCCEGWGDLWGGGGGVDVGVGRLGVRSEEGLN